MTRRILVINAHPDPHPGRLCAALADAYTRGARAGGQEIRRIDVGALDFPPIVTGDELEADAPPAIREAQDAITWAQHIVIVYPLWLSAPPALLKSFFEQICRYDFAFDHKQKPLLGGRTARFIVTMIVPAFVFRLLFAQATRGFARGALWTSGIKPTRVLALGNVLAANRAQWLVKVESLGKRGG